MVISKSKALASTKTPEGTSGFHKHRQGMEGKGVVSQTPGSHTLHLCNERLSIPTHDFRIRTQVNTGSMFISVKSGGSVWALQ